MQTHRHPRARFIYTRAGSSGKKTLFSTRSSRGYKEKHGSVSCSTSLTLLAEACFTETSFPFHRLKRLFVLPPVVCAVVAGNTCLEALNGDTISRFGFVMVDRGGCFTSISDHGPTRFIGSRSHHRTLRSSTPLKSASFNRKAGGKWTLLCCCAWV